MRYLNVGCGHHYSQAPEWINLDFDSTGPNVVKHNLLNGIPFDDESFDVVYQSHVLEHFTKKDGENLISECFRVLKTGGVLRIAVPDLEQIVRHYINFLEKGINDLNNKLNYEWIMLEMYDQTVRSISGGNIKNYLFQESIENEGFVYQRIGEEGKILRNEFVKIKSDSAISKKNGAGGFYSKLKSRLKKYLFKKLNVNEDSITRDRFRNGGEIHQWMYDRYSLTLLLEKNGGKSVSLKDAFNSYIENWSEYNLDANFEIVRKPDSLFIEAIK